MADWSEERQAQTDTSRAEHRLSLADWRESYGLSELHEEQCERNPIVLFERWIEEARAAGLRDAGFIFYTNYTSRKARELDSNPYAALTFFWPQLERQVRVEGEAHRLTREQNEAYFRTRARGSQLGAWASHQSQPIASRAVLEARLEELKQRFAHLEEVPAPEFWGGYCVRPFLIEFWQGQPDRLHDRLCYRRKGEDGWIIERLSP